MDRSNPRAEYRAVSRDRVIVFPTDHGRPLLCSREHIGRPRTALFPNSEYCELWTSPLRYSDPPPDTTRSPTGAPWVIYAEYLQRDDDRPHRPDWCIPAVESEMPASSYRLALGHWTPLSAAWSLKEALLPVLDVIEKRHQPFVARLHVDEDEIAQLKRVYSAPAEIESAMWRAHFASINIGEVVCPACEPPGSGKISLETMRVDSTCRGCRGTGVKAKWHLSIQASYGHHCAPRMHRSALGGDISLYYLWEVSHNVEREHLRKLNVPHDVIARFSGSDIDPAYALTAEDIQTVIDALENEAKNTGGPVLYDGPRGEGDFVEPSSEPRFDPKLARAAAKLRMFEKIARGTGAPGMSAHEFVEYLRKQAMGEPVNITVAEAEEIKRKWEADFPEGARALRRIANILENGAEITQWDGLDIPISTDPVKMAHWQRTGPREAAHLPTWDGRPPRPAELLIVNPKCTREGCTNAPRKSGELCEQHYQERLDSLAAHAIRGVGTSAAVASRALSVAGIRTATGQTFGSISEMFAAMQADARGRAENRNKSSFKRKDTKRSSTPKSPRRGR